MRETSHLPKVCESYLTLSTSLREASLPVVYGPRGILDLSTSDLRKSAIACVYVVIGIWPDHGSYSTACPTQTFHSPFFFRFFSIPFFIYYVLILYYSCIFVVPFLCPSYSTTVVIHCVAVRNSDRGHILVAGSCPPYVKVLPTELYLVRVKDRSIAQPR